MDCDLTFIKTRENSATAMSAVFLEADLRFVKKIHDRKLTKLCKEMHDADTCMHMQFMRRMHAMHDMCVCMHVVRDMHA